MFGIESVTFSEGGLVSGANVQADDDCLKIIEEFIPMFATEDSPGVHRFWIGVEAVQLIHRGLARVRPTDPINDVRDRMDYILRVAELT